MLDPATGLPVGFTDMALADHLALWSAAPARLFTQSRHAALLVSLHGTRLYELRDLDAMEPGGADAVREFLAAQRALQERLARGDKPGGTLWYAARKVAAVGPRKVHYDIDTAGGQSGSGVYRFLNNERHVFGVHAYGGATTNSGTRINGEVFNNLLSWNV
ncbi:MAG: DUF3891 family protein [Solirubrobacteraceae bacterium MAG38_C4-C5]|nr:DUF3891 family protein [Candidatus Siliceabacter maunaloa]